MVHNIKVAFELEHLPVPEQVQIFNNIAFIFIIVHFMKKKKTVVDSAVGSKLKVWGGGG